MIDAATRESLELIRSATGARAGSLLACIDRTITGAGARLLAADIGAPLLDQKRIEARLDLVGLFERDSSLRDGVRRALGQLPDLGRALGRLTAGRGSPRDLGQLRDGLRESARLGERLSLLSDPPPLLILLLPALAGHDDLVDLLSHALVTSPPIDSGQGGYIAEGHDATLDEYRGLGGEGRRGIAALEARYREQTGIGTLKIRHNAVLGYHVEVPVRHADRLLAPDSGFVHRQTMAGAIRFNAPELHDLAMRVAQAGTRALAIEAAHLDPLIEARARQVRADRRGRRCAGAARCRCRACRAGRARGWSRPRRRRQQLSRSKPAATGGGGALWPGSAGRFVANDCALSEESRLWLVTGPNMGGKVDLPSPERLIAILARLELMCPPASAILGLVDRLFAGSALRQSGPRRSRLHGRNGRNRRDPRQATEHSSSSSTRLGGERPLMTARHRLGGGSRPFTIIALPLPVRHPFPRTDPPRRNGSTHFRVHHVARANGG